MDAVVATEVKQDSKNMAMLNWLGTLFLGFIPCLILFLVKKDDEFVLAHAREALNWSITAFIGYAISSVLAVILIGIVGFFVIGIFHLIYCIKGMMAGSAGNAYQPKFMLRLLK